MAYSKNIWIGTDLGNEGKWNTTANWDVASVPEDADDVYLTNSSQDVTTDLNQSTIEPASLWITKSYTGKIAAATTYLQIGPVVCNIGTADASGNGVGSGRINLNFGSDPVTVNVYSTNTAATDAGMQPVRLIGSNITAVNVYSGNVCIAPVFSETATVTTVNVLGQNANVYLGVGVTATNINVAAGTLTSYSTNATTTVNVSGGTFSNFGTGTITTVNSNGGTYNHNGTATVTTLNITGIVSYANDPRAKTVTNCFVYGGGNLNTNNGNPLSITFTNGINLKKTKIGAVTLDLGNNYNMVLSTSA
jgi:hypothetical protein